MKNFLLSNIVIAIIAVLVSLADAGINEQMDAALGREVRQALDFENNSIWGARVKNNLSQTKVKEGRNSVLWRLDEKALYSQESLSLDFSSFDTLSLAIWSPDDKPTHIQVHLMSTEDQKSNFAYYKQFASTSAKGWSTVEIPFSEFRISRKPVGWNKITRITFYSMQEGEFKNNPNKTIFIDSIKVFKKSALSEDTNLTDSARMQKVFGKELAASFDFENDLMWKGAKRYFSKAKTKSGAQSIKWDMTQKAIFSSEKIDQDWSRFDTFSVWAWKPDTSKTEMQVHLLSTKDPESFSYFRKNITLQKSGWNQIVIPFKGFKVARKPVGFNFINRITFYSLVDGKHQAIPGKIIYLDKIELLSSAN